MRNMKYLLLTEPHNISIEDKEIPEVKDNDVLIKIECCGFCGTDFLIYNGNFPVHFPYSPGHEYVGKVVETGKNATGLSKGDRVTVDPNFHCDNCYYCRSGEINLCVNQKTKVKSNGGFAEYVVVPSSLAYKLSENISSGEAVFIETISCCLHAIDKSEIKQGEKVLILGAGALGLIILQLVKGIAGKVIISEPIEIKRKIASHLGVDIVINPVSEDITSIIKKETNDHGVDKIIDCSGKIEAVKKSIKILRKGGTLVLSAIYPLVSELTIKPLEILQNEIIIKGSFLNPFTYTRSIEILSNNKIKVEQLITHRFKLKEIEKAYKTFLKGEAIKILIEI